MSEPLVTPDGRYIVVRGRLWRRSDPRLPEAQRQQLVDGLMDARRAVGRALRSNPSELSDARKAVDAAKVALGERGPTWWDDDSPDLTRRWRGTPVTPTGMRIWRVAGERLSGLRGVFPGRPELPD